MKKFIYITLLMFPFIFTSCLQEDEDDNVYYIRYEASVNKPSDGIFKVVFTMSDGKDDTIKYSEQEDFSVVIGPVKHGFKARIHATCTGETNCRGAYTRILVSRNNEPFALKDFHGGESYTESMSEYVIAY